MMRLALAALAALLLAACASPPPPRPEPRPEPKAVAPPPVQTGPQPMTDAEFAQLKRTIAMELGDKAKIATLGVALGDNWITAAQAGKLLDVVVYREGKLEALPSLRARILDKKNTYLLIQKFTYREDKEKAKEILGGGEPE